MTLAENIRKEFPQLQEKVYGKQLVYLDNAATSLRPRSVVEEYSRLALEETANIHRAVHFKASQATQSYENARVAVQKFIGASSPKEIILTEGTTASLNIIARSFGELLSDGDEIVVAECEHHSDIVPWQMLCERKGTVLKVLPVLDDGTLDLQTLSKMLEGGRVKLVCVAQVSNILGIVNPVKEIAAMCHRSGALLSVDGAQGIVHCLVNVQDMDCDFYSFSGHKIYGPTGTGVLYGKKELLEKMPPVFGGGEMIDSVKWSGTTYEKPPVRFEAGTRNFTSFSCLPKALETAEMLRDVDMAPICDYVMGELAAIEGLTLYGTASPKVPLFSFSIEGAHHEDLALILDKMGVALRSGQMCAEPLMDRFGVSGMLRASFAPYNTLDEARTFITSLRKAITMVV